MYLHVVVNIIGLDMYCVTIYVS